MNIAVYTHYFAPEISAPSTRWLGFAREWLKAGHQPQIVTCFPNHPNGVVLPGYEKLAEQKYHCELMEGIKVHRNWTYITPNKGILKKTIGHVTLYPSSVLRTRPRMDRPDVVVGTSPTFFAASAALNAARKFKVPFVMEVRDLWPAALVELGVIRFKPIIKMLELYEMSLYRNAARVVTVTESFRRTLIQRGLSPDKVVTIYNGAEPARWEPKPASEEVKAKFGVSGKFVISYIGTHGISQALDTLVRAADRLKDVPDIAFLFVGEGADKAKLIQMTQQLGLSNVHFHDSVKKDVVRELYALSDILIVSLKKIELFKSFIPSKMFEMLCMERPLIALVEGESAEILAESKGAVIVEPENDATLAMEIQKLYSDRGLGSGLAARGREFVHARFSTGGLARRYGECLSDAVQRPKV